MWRRIIASVLFGLLAQVEQSQAQVGQRLLPPSCWQGMIAGSWQALLQNPYLGFTLACSLQVSSTGAITNSTCGIGNFTHGGYVLTQPPSGTLNIDSACRVTGLINYTVCAGPPCNNPSSIAPIQTLPSLWRSPDGGRLSGYVKWIDPNGGTEFYPLDLIAGQ